MDPLITNGIDPLLLVLEKRGQERDRDPVPRRKRPAASETVVPDAEEENDQESAVDAPKHTLDDLA